ncbi:MAG: tetratricopeptide repeat protein [Chloroflexi bacterium]|nr:tetratricopeptide repeat protein [Chloroflexota bacterium]
MALRSRPYGVSLLAGLLIGTGLLQLMLVRGQVLFLSIMLSGAGLPFVWQPWLLPSADRASLPPGLLLFQAGLDLLVGAGLLRGWRWAWVAAQVWAALLVAVDGVALAGWSRLLVAAQVAVVADLALRLATLAYWRRTAVRAFFGSTVGGQGRVAPARKYEGMLARADRYLGKRRPDRALAIVQKVIRDLAEARPLSPEHQRCLGLAYATRGNIQAQQGQPADAAGSFLAARPFVSLPDPSLVFLANRLAAAKTASETAIGVYLDYLRLRRRQPEADTGTAVYAALQRLCQVQEQDAHHQWATTLALNLDKSHRVLEAGASEHQWAAALALCQRVLEADDSLEWAHYYVGLALARQGDLDQAASHLDAAARLDPAVGGVGYPARIYGALLAERQGNRLGALAAYREAAARRGDRWEAHFYLARALADECEAEAEQDRPGSAQVIAELAREAVGSAARAAARRPDLPECHFYHGRALSFAGDNPAAVEAFRAAVRLRPTAKEYHLRLGEAWGRLSNPTEALQEPRPGQETDYARALQAVEQAVALDEDYAEGHRVRGDLEALAQQYGRAETRYRRALQLDPHQRGARLGLGRALFHQQRYHEAIRELEPLHERVREAAYLLARCCSLGGDFARAVRVLSVLADRGDAEAETYYAVGCARANLAQYAEAVKEFDLCLQLDPSRWRAHLQRGHCYLALGEVAKAQQEYQQAEALQPESVEVALSIAQAHVHQGEAARARPHLERVLRAQPAHWEASMLLGRVLESVGDLPGAERAYLAALGSQPGQPETLLRLGQLCCHQARHEEAVRYLEQVAALGEEGDALLFHSGYARAGMGDYAGALETWAKLQQRYPEDRRLALNVRRLHYLLGHQHAEAGRYEAAIVAWEEYLGSRQEDEKLRGDIAELYFRLAATRLAGGGKPEAAREDLDAALDLDADHPWLAYYQALCDLAEGEWALAAQRLEACSNGSHPALRLRALYHRGLAFLRAGQPERAAEVLQTVASHPDRKDLTLPVDLVLAIACARSQCWDEALAALQPVAS